MKAIINWSRGKDSTWALHQIKQHHPHSSLLLLTTISKPLNQVTMHGIPENLIQLQVQALQFPARSVYLPEHAGMEEYNNIMLAEFQKARNEGYTEAIYGDIFLEDLKSYREKEVTKAGLSARFPLWKEDTSLMVRQFIQAGYKAVVVCVSDTLLGKSFAGRELNESFLNDLPNTADPCGENGEFHTFVYDGPLFKHPVNFSTGEKVLRKYPNPSGKEPVSFWFINLHAQP